ncbi:MAG TPA: UPF0182 family protein, partial [Caulobacteraceae bacterium]|nr:UPF0182 family protein [Caulobacteraceae bacterium]
MFGLAYLVLLLVASIPLALTVLRNRGQRPSAALARRLYRDLAYIGLGVVAIIVFETATRLALEGYWFAELGQERRFWLAFGLEVAVFAGVFVIGGAFVAIHWRLAARRLANVPPSAPLVAGFVAAALVASGATGIWAQLAGALGATPSGIRDPAFGLDLSFYLLRLPVYEAAANLAMTLIVLTIVGWALIGSISYLRMPFRLRRQLADRRGGRLSVVAAPAADTVEAVMARALAAGEAAWRGWLPQGLGLGALFCLACALLRFLGRYHLVIDGHSGVVAGASWIDV